MEGYVAAQYVATGDEAQSIADTAGYTTAQVGAEVLNMRASADEDGEIIGAIYEADEVEVVEDCGDWVKVVASDGTYGYVSADYVQTNTFYATGETLEEEQARLDQEWLDYLAQQEAEQAAAEAAYIASLGYTENYSYSEPSYGYSDAQAAADAAAYEAQAWAADAASASYDAQANADAQYQAYLDAQAAADAATQSTDEESIYAAAAEAQAAYEAYLSAQAEADAAAQAEADAAYAAQAAAEAAENVEDTYYEDTYTDDTYYDDSYTEDTYTEDTYTEDTEDGYSEQSYSSVGQQIADYAVQFVGNPYVWGGTSLTNGADCSGFVLSVFANFGISLPHSAAAQSGYGTAVSGDSLQPGDLHRQRSGGTRQQFYDRNYYLQRGIQNPLCVQTSRLIHNSNLLRGKRSLLKRWPLSLCVNCPFASNVFQSRTFLKRILSENKNAQKICAQSRSEG